MIVIIDYGMGNLRSVQKGFEQIGAKAVVSRDPFEIEGADRLVLPGVGAFPECMRNLESLKLLEPIKTFISSNRPFLGICLGLQLLFDESEEFGVHQGLGIIPGKVRAFERVKGLKIPHMGWNQIGFLNRCPIFDGVEDGSYFYFVHSFYVDPYNREDAAAETEYGIMFTSAVWLGNVFAVQFHPEKSQENGLTILKNFSSM